MNPPEEFEANQILTMDLSKKRFPFLFQGRDITIDAMELFVKIKPEFAAEYESSLRLSLEAGTEAPENPDEVKLTLVLWNGLLRANKEPAGLPGKWSLTSWLEIGGEHGRLDANAIEDILLVCRYSL